MIEEIENYINGEDYPDEIPKRIMGLFEREHADLLAEVKQLREELNYARVTLDEWDKTGPCVTVYHEGCEYVGCLRLYKNEDGEVIE